ncbi:MAG TPA: hypothetical protein VKG01_14200 [Thermoanaerobaculia bacterium]|nr:hypothetical protein [Thermoanaerobaculia bacterium]
MKKLLLLAVLAAAAWFGYTKWFADREAIQAYEKFAHAWSRGDTDEAARHGEKQVAENAIQSQNLRGMRSGSIMEAFHGERYEIESKTAQPDGGVRLEVKQTILFDPPGATTGIGGAMWTTIHHSATLHRTPEGWKVTAFEAKYLDMGETRRR